MKSGVMWIGGRIGCGAGPVRRTDSGFAGVYYVEPSLYASTISDAARSHHKYNYYNNILTINSYTEYALSLSTIKRV